MGSGKKKTTSASAKMDRRSSVFTGMVAVCLLLLSVLALCDDRLGGPLGRESAVAESGTTTEKIANQKKPQEKDGANADSVQSVQTVQSVQSVQSVQVQSIQSIQSVQSVQGGAGVAIADIGSLDLADIKARADLPPEWQNILLLGSDSRDMKNISLLDTIIIASINETTGELKLTSILRDTVVPIPGQGMQRINTAAYFGGPSLLMQVVNENFGMNITEYVLVNFEGMAKAIDALGGINLDIDQLELSQINSHMGEIARYTMDQDDYLAKREEMLLKEPGEDVTVNGIQAVTYARIRSIDTDAARTGRQRRVIASILRQAEGAQLGQLLGTARQMWGNLITNVDVESAVALARSVKSVGVKGVSEFTIPCGETRQSDDGALLDVDLAENTRQLYEFIYGSADL